MHIIRKCIVGLIMMFLVISPAVTQAAFYDGIVTQCPEGHFVPKGESCGNNMAFFACAMTVLAAALAASVWLAWIPPLALAAFSGIFVVGILACRAAFPDAPPSPDLSPNVTTLTTIVANTAWSGSTPIRNLTTGTAGPFVNRMYFDFKRDGWDGNGVDGDFQRDQSISSLLPSATIASPLSLTFTDAQIGNWRVRSTADIANTVAETNESNNTSSWDNFTVTPTPRADLVPANLVRAGTLSIGQTQTLTGVVRNTGTANSSATNARFCIDNPNCANTTTGRAGTDVAVTPAPLTIGATSANLTRTWVATPGTHRVYMCSDVTNAVTELNETNNCISTATFDIPASNLVTNVINASSYIRNTSYTVPFSVQNNGSIATGVGFSTNVYFDYGRNAATASCPPASGNTNDFCRTVATGALTVTSRNLDVTGVTFAQTGDWRVNAAVDSSNAVAESNESDNTSSWNNFTVTAPLPSATLSRCNATTDAQNCSSSSSGWGTGNLTIITGHDVRLKWTSTNSTSCNGTNFATGGATSNNTGVNVTTAATPATSPFTYTLLCDDSDPSTAAGSSRVDVTANDAAPTLTAPSETVRTGEDFTLNWNLNGNNPTTCSFTTGADAPTDVVSTTQATIEAVGTSTYTLTCAGGTATLTIQVTPQYYES